MVSWYNEEKQLKNALKMRMSMLIAYVNDDQEDDEEIQRWAKYNENAIEKFMILKKKYSFIDLNN